MPLILALGRWREEGIWLGGERNIKWEEKGIQSIQSDDLYRQDFAFLLLRILYKEELVAGCSASLIFQLSHLRSDSEFYM